MKYLLSFIFSLLPLYIWSADGDTFKAQTTEGVEMTFKVISEQSKTCQVGDNDNDASGRAIDMDYSGFVTIPSQVNGYTVTSIGDYVFHGCYSLKGITIPNTVKSIGRFAFCGCNGLTSITIPSSVTSIGDGILSDCNNLANITVESGNKTYDSHDNCNAIIETSTKALIAGCKNTVIPNSVTSIGSYAFYGCSNLTPITIPNSVTSIGDRAFSHCSGLTSITIPNSVTSIGSFAFFSSLNLRSINIPSSVTTIGEGAFSGINNLTIMVDKSNTKYDSRDNCNAIIETESNILIAGNKNTVIPNSVTSIGSSVFYCCTSLTSIDIPNSVTSIGDNAFRNCISLTSIDIPNSVTSIGSWAFDYCTHLTSINIPNSVTSIGDNAFSSCSNLTSIDIPNSVTSIGSYAFWDCTSLTSIDIPNSVTSIGSDAFMNCTSLTSIDIPNSVTSISSGAFSGCTSLTSINIPNSVTSISSNAFYCCTSLTSIDIPNSVMSIGSYAFRNCISLTSIDIPNSVTSIGDNAFWDCTSLTSIDIPNSVTSIGSDAFLNCSRLTKVRVEKTTPIAIKSSTFSIRANATLYVPKGSKAAYQAADYWKEFKEIVEYEVDENITFADAEVKAICVKNWDTNGDGELSKAEAAAVTSLGTVFRRNTSIKTFDELQYFTGLKEIDMNAFNRCENLTSIIIPNSVSSIGAHSFQLCALTSITIPNSVINIDSYAFNQLDDLTTITFPSSLESIGEHAFSSCGLTSLILPISLKTISPWAFSGCRSITSISVSNGNKYLDSRDNCNAVIESSSNTLILGCKNTNIPSSVTSIENTAFSHCGLTNITIPNSVINIGYGAFYGCDFTSITIPNSVRSIGELAFAYSYGLTNIIIPNSVTSIGKQSFAGCRNLSSLIIPSSVLNIGSQAFRDCPLIHIKVNINNPLTIDLGDFEFSNATLYVPQGSKSSYSSANYWKYSKTILEFPDTDVNQDGATDVVDVVDIARYVVGSPSDSFHEFLADLNSDDKVNVADAVVLVNDIAGNTSFAKAWHRMQSSDDVQEQLMLTKNKNNSLSLCMDNNRAYTAFQFDLMMNNDMNVMQMLLNESRKNGHQLLYNKVGDGHYRVVALSTANNSFNGKNGELLNIQLDGFDTDDLTIHNVHFFTGKGNDYAFDDLKLQGGTTAIEELPLVEGGQPSAVYDLQGRKQPTLRRGVNIVNGKKVIIK